ncbi:MAG: hypothetical protein ABIR51_05700 [Sphingomicrobium sp.]
MKLHTLTALTLALSGSALAQTVSTTAPATDSRGIPVISAPATAPAGVNVPVSVPAGTQLVINPNQAAAFTSAAEAATDLPPCSKTVTDRCVQTYERHSDAAGISARGHGHKHRSKR